MTSVFEDRSTYAPSKDAIAVVSLTVECSPAQVEHVLEFLAQVRDRAGVYSVDFETYVRGPEAQPVLEIVTLAALADIALPVDTADSNINVFAPGVQEALAARAEGEVHGEQAIQQPSDDAQATEVGSGIADVGGDGKPEPVGDGVAPVVAGPSGEVGAGSVERGA